MIRVIVAGFLGKMGSTTVEMVQEVSDFELVGLVDPNYEEKVYAELPVFQIKEEALAVQADVWIDFTLPSVAYENTKFCLENSLVPVVGTTGFTPEQIKELQMIAKEKQIGGLIAPNFSIGAVLMMLFSKKASKYFSDCEIIELHHEKKIDAPSGTAIKTAELIVEERREAPVKNVQEKETIQGARGADFEGIAIHSVRLPGLVAHQQVQFGAVGEGLTIRHDSYDRISFMKGVELGVRKSFKNHELLYGLENYLNE